MACSAKLAAWRYLVIRQKKSNSELGPFLAAY